MVLKSPENSKEMLTGHDFSAIMVNRLPQSIAGEEV
jgi:hypothetical protein